MILSTSRVKTVARQLTEMVSLSLDFKTLSCFLAMCIDSLIHEQEIIELLPSLVILSLLPLLVRIELSWRKFCERLVDRLIFQILTAIQITAQNFLTCPDQTMEKKLKKVTKFYLWVMMVLQFIWAFIVINVEKMRRAHIAILGISWILNMLCNFFYLVLFSMDKITKRDAGWIVELNRVMLHSCLLGLALDLGLIASRYFPVGHIVISALWVLVTGFCSPVLLAISQAAFSYRLGRLICVQQTYKTLSTNFQKVAMRIQNRVQLLQQLLLQAIDIFLKLPVVLRVSVVIGIICVQVLVGTYCEIQPGTKILTLFLNGKKMVVE